MLDRGVVTAYEKEILVKLKKKAQAVYVWANRILDHLVTEGKLTAHEAERLEENLSTTRGLAAKQIAYQLTTIPKPYFHLMTTLTHSYLLLELTAAAERIVSAANTNPVLAAEVAVNLACGVVSVFVLMSMWRTAIWLSNPVGDDVTDYDLDFDLRGLWEESLETLGNMKKTDGGATDLAERVLAHALTPAKKTIRAPAAVPADERCAVAVFPEHVSVGVARVIARDAGGDGP